MHRRRYFAKPRLVICVPSGITAVEQRAVKEAGYQAGARRVYIIEEPMAAAIGAGLPVHEATGNMVVDVGGGTTEVAVISLGGIVTSLSIRTAGDDLDQSIIAWMKKEYSLMLGERTAEEIKMTLGSAFPLPQEPEAEVRGRDMISGLPKTVVVSSRRGPDGPRGAAARDRRRGPNRACGGFRTRLVTAGLADEAEIDQHLSNLAGGRLDLATAPLISAWVSANRHRMTYVFLLVNCRDNTVFASARRTAHGTPTPGRRPIDERDCNPSRETRYPTCRRRGKRTATTEFDGQLRPGSSFVHGGQRAAGDQAGDRRRPFRASRSIPFARRTSITGCSRTTR